MRCSDIMSQWWLYNLKYSKSHWTVHFKLVNVTGGEIYLNISLSIFFLNPRTMESWEEKSFMRKMTFHLWIKCWGVVCLIEKGKRTFQEEGKLGAVNCMVFGKCAASTRLERGQWDRRLENKMQVWISRVSAGDKEWSKEGKENVRKRLFAEGKSDQNSVRTTAIDKNPISEDRRWRSSAKRGRKEDQGETYCDFSVFPPSSLLSAHPEGTERSTGRHRPYRSASWRGELGQAWRGRLDRKLALPRSLDFVLQTGGNHKGA